jgi:hypothetical protein
MIFPPRPQIFDAVRFDAGMFATRVPDRGSYKLQAISRKKKAVPGT